MRAAVYQLICDPQGRFYQGQGKWTDKRELAYCFSSLPELMEECGNHGIRKCRVLELLPRQAEFELTIEPR